MACFISERTGRNYGIIFTLPFSIRLSPSQIHGFCVCGQNTRISTVPTCGIGLPSCSVWLFNTLFNRSKANRRIFDCPSLKNRFPTKKAFCFSLSAAFAFCFLLTDFLGFYYLQTFAVCLTFESLYMFFVSFLCFAFGVAFPVRLHFNSKTKISILQIFFFEELKNRV
jgi:hypothetical protein